MWTSRSPEVRLGFAPEIVRRQKPFDAGRRATIVRLPIREVFGTLMSSHSAADTPFCYSTSACAAMKNDTTCGPARQDDGVAIYRLDDTITAMSASATVSPVSPMYVASMLWMSGTEFEKHRVGRQYVLAGDFRVCRNPKTPF